MKLLHEIIDWLAPSKNGFRMIALMIPAIIFGWIFLPIGSVTYTVFIQTVMLVIMWLDIMDIRDKLDIK